MAGRVLARFGFEHDVATWIFRTAALIDERNFSAKDVAEAYDFAERFDALAVGSVSPGVRCHGEPLLRTSLAECRGALNHRLHSGCSPTARPTLPTHRSSAR